MTAALSALVLSIASAVGLEGAFLVAGTALLAVGASFFNPAAPYLVVGGMCVLIGLALARPAGR